MMNESSFGRIGTVLLIVVSTVVGVGVVTAEPTTSAGSDAGDTRARAAPIDVGSEVNGTIGSTDTDWYAVELEEGEGFSAQLTSIGSNGTNLRVSVYSPNGTPISVDNRGSEEQSTTRAVGGVVERSGTYHVKVEAVSNGSGKQTDYALTVTSRSLDEYDPNERRSQAAPIESGETVSGVMTGYDREYFSVSADAGSVISIKTSAEDSRSIDAVYVYGPEGERIHTHEPTGDGNGARIPVKQSGNYTIELVSDLGATDSLDYTLTVETDTRSSDANDTRHIEPGETIKDSIGSNTNATRRYAVELENGQGFTVLLKQTNRKNPNEEMSFEVRGPNGNQIGEAPFDRSGRAYHTNRAAASAYGGDVAERSGTYYITVTGMPDASYSLTVNTVELDENDPNENIDSATEITGNDAVSGVLTGYDRDVYAIGLKKGETITVDYNSSGEFAPSLWATGPTAMNRSHDSEDYSFGRHTIARSHSGNDLTFTANRTGTYYVKAVPYFEGSTARTFFESVDYNMRVRVSHGRTVMNVTYEQRNKTAPLPETVRLNANTPTPTPTPTSSDTATQTTTSAPNTSTANQPTTAAPTATETPTNSNTNGNDESTPTSTATDGPGFGVLAALVGLGLGVGWYRSRD